MSDAAERNLRNVIVFALADGKLADTEKGFISNLRERLGIGESEFGRLCAEVGENPKKLSLPADRDEALETVSLLVDLATADGVVDEIENRLLRQLATKAGLEEADLERLLAASKETEEAHADEIEVLVEEMYKGFDSWDPATRKSKLDAIGSFGKAATIPLLRMFESYRMPAGSGTALELKVMIVETLGGIGDRRAAYYLIQQIQLGDMEDEVTCASLRYASAAALARCVREKFTPDQEGVEAARDWWLSGGGNRKYNQLAF